MCVTSAGTDPSVLTSTFETRRTGAWCLVTGAGLEDVDDPESLLRTAMTWMLSLLLLVLYFAAVGGSERAPER